MRCIYVSLFSVLFMTSHHAAVPVAWVPSLDFKAVSAAGTVFNEVDPSDDWAEYDEKADVSVAVSNLEHKIERL